MSYCMHCMEPMQDGAPFCPACGKPQVYDCPENFLRPGTRLNGGRYLVGAAIGEGGFGITYMGRDLRLDMTVAIKEFYPDGYVNRDNSATCNITATMRNREFFEKGKEKFLAEARILASLHDAVGIVDVRDFFEENNTTYIVMEFLNGETLKGHLKKVGKMPYQEVYQLLLPAMHSLVIVHQKGVIHRDISPDNIMLSQTGVKLLDFGAAREAFSDDERSYSVLLKRGYSPVEQYTKKNQGPGTDVYALCATMYRCITGVVPTEPFLREQEPLRRPSELGIAISKPFEMVLMNGLAMYPEQRYQTVDALIAAFEAALRGEEPQRTVVTVAQTRTATLPLEETVQLARPGQPVQPPVPLVRQPGQPVMQKLPPQQVPGQTMAVGRGGPVQQKKGGAGKWIAIALAAVVVLGGAVFAILWMHNRNSDTEETTTTKAAIPIVIEQAPGQDSTPDSSTPPVLDEKPVTPPSTSPQGYPSAQVVCGSGTYQGAKKKLEEDYPGSYQIGYDEQTGDVLIWIIPATGYYDALRSSSPTALSDWDDYITYCRNLSYTLKEYFDGEGFTNVNCTVGVLNDTNTNHFMLSCTNGVVTDDIVNERATSSNT